MSLPVAVAVIVLADLVLIGLLAFVMSRPRLLRPHVTTTVRAADTPSRRETRVPAGWRRRTRDRVPSEDAPALPARA